MGGRFSAWRAALRMARRDAWRNKGRSALVAIMVALPVMAASVVSVVVRSDQRDPQDEVRLAVGHEAQARVTVVEAHEPVDQSARHPTLYRQDGDGSQVQIPTVGGSAILTADDSAHLRARLAAMLPRRDRLVSDLSIESGARLRVGDRLVYAVAREFDYTAPGVGGLVEQVSGRAPAKAGEVVVSESLARYTGVGDGDRVAYTPVPGEPARTLTVVGVVGGVPLIGQRQFIGPPGTLAPSGRDALAHPGSWYVVGPDPVTWDHVLDINELGAVVASRAVAADPPAPSRVPYDQAEAQFETGPAAADVGVVVVVVGLVLLQIALLAGPAIAVGARRNQRGLAIVAAGGAEQRHLRAVVLAASGVIGVVSCLVAAVAGAAIGAVAVVALRRYAEMPLARVDVHVLDLLGLAAVGALTAVAAALVPAWQVSRLDVVAALTGRRGLVRSSRRVPLIGLATAAAGGVMAALGAGRESALLTVTGIALAEVGLVVAMGGIVGVAAKVAGRLPVSGRFALRDAARQRSRTAPAVAAVMAAIAGSVASVMYLAAEDAYSKRLYEPQHALGVMMVNGGEDAEWNPATVTAVLRREMPVDQVVSLRSPVGRGSSNTSVVALRTPPHACPVDMSKALTPQQEDIAERDRRCFDGPPPGALSVGGEAIIDDGSVTALVRGTTEPAVRDALADGRVVVFDPRLLWPGGQAHLQVVDTPADYDDETDDAAERTVVVPAVLSRQSPPVAAVVIPPAVARTAGLHAAQTGIVASTTRLPTGREVERAAAALEEQTTELYLYVERGHVSDTTLVVFALVAAAGVVALGGTFSAVGLAAAESRPDLATLAAVGASPGLRRRLAASQAAVIAGLGAALGTVSGVGVGWALVRLDQQPLVTDLGEPLAAADARWQVVVPWPALAMVAFGLPLLVAAVGFLTTRSRLPVLRRLGQ